MEMRIEKNGSQRGARIDIYTSTGSQGEIIELKRASHPLIAYKNKNSARPSKLLIRGVKQTERYGTLILALKNQEKLIKKQIPIPNNIRLRLIAGRRLKSHNSYTLINALRSESPNITIVTWSFSPFWSVDKSSTSLSQ
ncbi:MAG: hypothetical protein COW00_18770 [Bdellovibrio sp. CG12_big_fil_rev_8_21_14_0_65_39_13]|nr:MAG: hypothetical protein COW00_18770 [Bdellovibrio sp. CG12_big_fil_rev_8_21_14_0_65_39_13]PIR33995.1 MAG: hypothetical protein COV37_14390 [Bdellovibrio sp. CG11_big_fil_rev_8_21_14_0_20_39_38]